LIPEKKPKVKEEDENEEKYGLECIENVKTDREYIQQILEKEGSDGKIEFFTDCTQNFIKLFVRHKEKHLIC